MVSEMLELFPLAKSKAHFPLLAETLDRTRLIFMIDCLSRLPSQSDNFRARDQVGPTGTIPMLLGSRNAIERSRVPRANRDVSVMPAGRRLVFAYKVFPLQGVCWPSLRPVGASLVTNTIGCVSSGRSTEQLPQT